MVRDYVFLKQTLQKFKLFFVCCCLLFLVAGCFNYGHINLKRAEEYTRQGKYADAIAAYRSHISDRLNTERPEWENPYFYLLLIGDVQIKADDIDAALATFELADRNRVDATLVSDRYRFIAVLLERGGQYDQAIALLKKYRERDPLLYDMILDRIARAVVAQEEKTK